MLLVLGGGPGGYVAAIRAGQLGVPTVLVERSALGGTCLNIGCIPSEALIHAADSYEQAIRFAKGKSALGICTSEASINLERTQTWKQGIVERLTSGVGTLLRKAGVRVMLGRASVIDGKTVEVLVTGEEPFRITCEHLLLATGSDPIELGSLRPEGVV